jgi:tripartite-type tricarboxylate transporter receptor subunit TctC
MDSLPFVGAAFLFIALLIAAAPVLAQEPFFKGKTIRIIVGFSPGGGYDVYARAIARHMGKYIPGNPSINVENMAGAASLISANYVLLSPARRWQRPKKESSRSNRRTPPS